MDEKETIRQINYLLYKLCTQNSDYEFELKEDCDMLDRKFTKLIVYKPRERVNYD